MRPLSRRTFLQTATAATLAAQLKPSSGQLNSTAALPYPENGTLIPDDDWRLWIDEKAEWKNDPLFLPEDITVDAEGVLHGKGSPLPVPEPSGGWDLLDHITGIVNDKSVVADRSNEGGQTCSGDQGGVARASDQSVIAAVADDGIATTDLGAEEICGAGEDQNVDAGG